MSSNDLFLSNKNCQFLYKIIQDNVKLETNVDINKDPNYYNVLKDILNNINKNTKPGNNDLKKLNNLVINKTIPYFCDLAKKEDKPNYNKNNIDPMFDLLSNKSHTQNLGMTVINKFSNSIDNFTTLQSKKNKLQSLELNKTQLNKQKNLRKSLFEGGNTTKTNSDKLQNINSFKNNKVVSNDEFIEGFQDTGSDTDSFRLKRAIIENITPKKENEILREYLLCIDSKDASGSNYYPYSFTVDINTQRSTDSTHTATITNLQLRNVVEIELMSCIVSKVPFNDTSGNRYLILKVDEISQAIHGTNSDLTNAFAILVPDRQYIESHEVDLTNTTEDGTTTIHKYVLCKNLYPKKTYYGTPLAQLNRLTISFVNQDGTTVNKSGSSSADWSTYWTENTNILLKVTTREHALS